MYLLDFNSASGRQPATLPATVTTQTYTVSSGRSSVVSAKTPVVRFAAEEKTITGTNTGSSVATTVGINETAIGTDMTTSISNRDNLSQSQDSSYNTSLKDGRSMSVTSPLAMTPSASTKTSKNKYLASKLSVGDDAFSDFGYWRVPIPLIDEK